MFLRNATVTMVLCMLVVLSPLRVHANSTEEPDEREREAAEHRRTLFGPVNPNSRFGLDWFPETLRAPEMDLAYSEIRLDWFHAERSGHQEDEITAKFERSFGALTVEIELPYLFERDVEIDEDTGETERDRQNGFSKIELGARYPIFQWVSEDARVDYTVVAALEVALPARSGFTEDSEISPRLYNLLRVGEHFGLQGSFGYAKIIGPENGGADVLEYAMSLSYRLGKDDLDLPGIRTIAPIFELVGENHRSGEERGANPLFGVVGVRANTLLFEYLQPSIGIGYEFPMNHHARDELEWGVLLSLNFEL